MAKHQLQIGSVQDVCADCGANEPHWVSLNRGVFICDDCCLIHRSLGRHISQVKSLAKSVWRPTQMQMITDLQRSGSNSIWEHTLLDPLTGKTAIRRKPSAKDPIHPNKSEFIRAKYQNLSFINRSTNKEESEADISEQLHSSVRTPNLKTSLRLLASGADLNYIHNEKYNSPLHMAAKAGQMSQIELLLVYGANPCIVDVKGRTPIDYAKDVNFGDIVDRLVESQYELSDRLTYFVCARVPNHKSGQHFLVPEIVDSNGESRHKLQTLSNRIFEELARDLYDEVDRREIDAIYTATAQSHNVAADRQVVPFLPVNPHFSSTRNQGRQKLALHNPKEFAQLIVDVLHEMRRRIQCYDNIDTVATNSATKSLGWPSISPANANRRRPTEGSDGSSDYDSEPLYDSVPSEDDETPDYKSFAPKNLNKNSLAVNRSHSGKKSATGNQSKSLVTPEDYTSLKDQLSRSDTLIQELVLGNQDMRHEITRLQVMVQKLIDENGQLRAVVIPKSPSCQTDVRSSPTTTMDMSSPPEILPRNAAKAPTRPQSMFNERSIAPSSASPTKTSSSLSNLQQNPQNNSSFIPSSLPNDNKCISNQQMSQHLAAAAAAAADTSFEAGFRSIFPHKEDVLRKTEQITRCIQELLLTAQEGRHQSFDSCSDKICSAVNTMITIFPESYTEMSANHPNGDQIYTALNQLHSSALKLRVECRTSLNVSLMPPHLKQDYRHIYQKVIESAFEIAKSAKTLVTLFQ